MRQIVSVSFLIFLAVSTNAREKPKRNGLFFQSDGPFPVLVSGKMGFIDRSGRIVIKPQFEVKNFIEDGSLFYEGRALIAQRDKKGFIDETGTMVIPPSSMRQCSFQKG